jgi:integrase
MTVSQMFLQSVEDPMQLLGLTVDVNSKGTYASSRNMVISRISQRTGLHFPYNTSGLLDFMTDWVVATEIATSTCTVIVSAFQHHYFAQARQKLPEHERTILLKMIKVRKQIVPEYGRIMGAISRDKLRQLIVYINNDRSLSQEKKRVYKDFALMMYGGCLRVFQLKALKGNSVSYDSGSKEITWIEVPIKGNQANLERKVVDEETSKEVWEIVNRRLKNNNNDVRLSLFPEADGQLDNEIRDYCRKVSVHCKWPVGLHFQGTHMFRHGAVQDAVAERGKEYGKLRSGHESDKCLILYAHTDAERLLKKDKMNNNNRKKEQMANDYLKAMQANYLKISKGSIAKMKFEKPGADLMQAVEENQRRVNHSLKQLMESQELSKINTMVAAQLPKSSNNKKNLEDKITELGVNLAATLLASVKDVVNELGLNNNNNNNTSRAGSRRRQRVTTEETNDETVDQQQQQHQQAQKTQPRVSQKSKHAEALVNYRELLRERMLNGRL